MGLPYTNTTLPYASPAARCTVCNGQYGGIVDGLCLHHQPLTTAPESHQKETSNALPNNDTPN